MCDLANCVGKTGTDVLGVLVQQWARFGLYKSDCVAGVGDGGGENEGVGGIHTLLEREMPDYVRRRCFGHLPWRVADQGLDAMGGAARQHQGHFHVPPRGGDVVKVEGAGCAADLEWRPRLVS